MFHYRINLISLPHNFETSHWIINAHLDDMEITICSLLLPLISLLNVLLELSQGARQPGKELFGPKCQEC